MNIIEEDTLPKREDCIHHVICKHNDGCCPMECGYFNPPVQDNNIERVEVDVHTWTVTSMGLLIAPESLQVESLKKLIGKSGKLTFEYKKEGRDE